MEEFIYFLTPGAIFIESVKRWIKTNYKLSVEQFGVLLGLFYRIYRPQFIILRKMPEAPHHNSQIITKLFNEHADYLYNYAITRVNDVYMAEDLVQETFISALKNYDSFQQKSKASTWLIAILKNKIIDHYRKKVREYHVISIDGIAGSEDFFDNKGHWKKDQYPQPWSFDADKGIEQEEFYLILKGCLKKLNDLQRMAFVMKHMEDVDTTEICKELDITASNYWVIIHRAKLQLRKCIETQWIND